MPLILTSGMLRTPRPIKAGVICNKENVELFKTLTILAVVLLIGFGTLMIVRWSRKRNIKLEASDKTSQRQIIEKSVESNNLSESAKDYFSVSLSTPSQRNPHRKEKHHVG